MTAALEGGESSAACPGRTLPPGKTRYPFYSRLVGPQGRSGRVENLVSTEIFFIVLVCLYGFFRHNRARYPPTRLLVVIKHEARRYGYL